MQYFLLSACGQGSEIDPTDDSCEGATCTCSIEVMNNTDYVYESDERRWDRYDDSFETVEAATSAADRTTQWFLND